MTSTTPDSARAAELQRPHNRPTFSSTWGTLLATAGVAIGLGNIWRFPYMMGEYGGAAFLLVYLVIVVSIGVPALMVEWALGRQTRRGTWEAFQLAGLPGGRFFSLVLLLTVAMAASYYGVVTSWVLYFGVSFAANTVGVETPIAMAELAPRVGLQMFMVAVTIGISGTILSFGVKRGIEQASRIALPLFFVLFAVLIVRVLTLPGAMSHLGEFLVPRWDRFTATTALAALGQAFFSLALGGTFMVAYGSYMRREEDIPKVALCTAGADVCAALMAGLVIVPAALTFSIPLNSGPPLMFEVMPEIFLKMSSGMVWGTLFFGSIFLVALLSLIAAYEVILAAMQDGLGWSRSRALVLLLCAEWLLALPAIIIDRYIEYSDLVWGTTMQTAGALVPLVALAWCMGRRRTLEELRANSRLPVPDWLYYWIRYVIPPAVVTMLVYGWVDKLTAP